MARFVRANWHPHAARTVVTNTLTCDDGQAALTTIGRTFENSAI